MPYLIALLRKAAENIAASWISGRISLVYHKAHAWYLRGRLRKNEAQLEIFMPMNKKQDEAIETNLRMDGSAYCSKCGRVSGLRYKRMDGSIFCVSLRKVKTNKGEAYLCHECYPLVAAAVQARDRIERARPQKETGIHSIE